VVFLGTGERKFISLHILDEAREKERRKGRKRRKLEPGQSTGIVSSGCPPGPAHPFLLPVYCSGVELINMLLIYDKFMVILLVLSRRVIAIMLQAERAWGNT
jgi:hypothetical protein